MGLVPLCFNPGVVGDGRLSACGSRTGSTLSWGHTGSSGGGTCPSRLDATPSPSSPSKPAQAQVPHLNVVEGQRLEGGGVLPLQPQHRLQHQGGVCSAWAVGCGAHGECCCMASHCQPLAKHVVPARTCQPGSPSMLPAAPPLPLPLPSPHIQVLHVHPGWRFDGAALALPQRVRQPQRHLGLAVGLEGPKLALQ